MAVMENGVPNWNGLTHHNVSPHWWVTWMEQAGNSNQYVGNVGTDGNGGSIGSKVTWAHSIHDLISTGHKLEEGS
jgi:hypothetical protein